VKNVIVRRVLYLIGPLVLITGFQVGAQTPQNDPQKNSENPTRSHCSRESGLEVVGQQVVASKLIDDISKRVAVMTRAADLLWPWDKETARTIFKDALDIASQDYHEKRAHQRQSAGLTAAPADMRYKVIAAMAKRDLAWARKFSEQILKDDADEAANEVSNNSEARATTAERLLSVAISILPVDQTSAIAFATSSFRFPATAFLSVFLYRLAAVDKSASDQLYQRALAAYADAPMNQFLFLSSYAFGNDREAGEMPNWTVYTVPANFTINANLQRLFLAALTRRARLLLQNPATSNSDARFSDTEQIWIALTRLRIQIEQSMPYFSAEAETIRASLFAMQSQTAQQRLTNTTTVPRKRSFAETVEQADRLANPARREQQLALAILRSQDEPLQQVLDAAAKIDEVDLRDNLLSWVYFERAQEAANQDLGAAQNLAEKVRELDLRAYLFSRIAELSIKQTKIDTKARELLESVLASAGKAPNTEPKVRALLGVAYLYSQIDVNRSIAILADAVQSINKIESPDFSVDHIERKIKGRAFTSYAILRTPGFNPENSFREIGKADFDGTLALVTNLSHKYLRSTITLILAEQCFTVDQNAKKKRAAITDQSRAVKASD
jgi:hypothetical protein